jgi:hypothetical protein
VNTLLIIIGIHAVLLGFAFLFAGFMSLVPLSEAEEEVRRRSYEAARGKSWWHGLAFALGEAASARYRGFSLAITHWPDRPHSRQLVYTGVLCLAVAAIIGYHFQVIP